MAQHSNRQTLLEGTLRCLERLPPERVTAREISKESGANLASITYHFGSKDELLTEAVILGLDRWLEQIAEALDSIGAQNPIDRLQHAAELIETPPKDAGLPWSFLSAMARAQHDERVRQLLAEGFAHTRPIMAAVLALGDNQTGEDTAGLIHAMFVGLLFQGLIDQGLAIEGDRLVNALAHLRRALPDTSE